MLYSAVYLLQLMDSGDLTEGGHLVHKPVEVEFALNTENVIILHAPMVVQIV